MSDILIKTAYIKAINAYKFCSTADTQQTNCQALGRLTLLGPALEYKGVLIAIVAR
jgi:hypothetical protein